MFHETRKSRKVKEEKSKFKAATNHSKTPKNHFKRSKKAEKKHKKVLKIQFLELLKIISRKKMFHSANKREKEASNKNKRIKIKL